MRYLLEYASKHNLNIPIHTLTTIWRSLGSRANNVTKLNGYDVSTHNTTIVNALMVLTIPKAEDIFNSHRNILLDIIIYNDVEIFKAIINNTIEGFPLQEWIQKSNSEVRNCLYTFICQTFIDALSLSLVQFSGNSLLHNCVELNKLDHAMLLVESEIVDIFQPNNVSNFILLRRI